MWAKGMSEYTGCQLTVSVGIVDVYSVFCDPAPWDGEGKPHSCEVDFSPLV
jgi:hypothetical protein